MKRDFEKELDDNQLKIVKYGGIIVLFILLLLTIAMFSLKINEESIIDLVLKSFQE